MTINLLLAAIKKVNWDKVALFHGFLFVFCAGMLVGRIPTKQETTASQNLNKRLTVTDRAFGLYYKLYGLCEYKYQLGADGNFEKANQVKGQMTQIESEADELFKINKGL